MFGPTSLEQSSDLTFFIFYTRSQQTFYVKGLIGNILVLWGIQSLLPLFNCATETQKQPQPICKHVNMALCWWRCIYENRGPPARVCWPLTQTSWIVLFCDYLWNTMSKCWIDCFPNHLFWRLCRCKNLFIVNSLTVKSSLMGFFSEFLSHRHSIQFLEQLLSNKQNSWHWRNDLETQKYLLLGDNSPLRWLPWRKHTWVWRR